MLTPTSQSTGGSEAAIIGARPANYRHSLEMIEQQKYSEATSDAPAPNSNNGNVLATPPKLQPSFSANDVPTLKQVSGSGVGTTPNHAAQQHLHNHNASMGRIPAGALRHSRELSADGRDNNATAGYQSLGSTLHANATPFVTPSQGVTQAPVLGQTPQTPVPTAIGNPQGVASFINAYYNTPGSFTSNGYGNSPGGYASTPGGYSSTGSAGLAGPSGFSSPATTLNSSSNGGVNSGLVGTMNGGFNGGQNGGHHGFPLLNMMANLSVSGTTVYTSTNSYSPANYANYSPVYAPQPRDSQARVMQNRRQQDNEGKCKLCPFLLLTDANDFVGMAPYNGQPLEAFGGRIYQLCKDQHGCRYLQKQLENRDPEHIKKVWLETCAHVVELMTDPFGNYLCQKLFEYCNDDQRTVLVQNASKDMIRVALNQHGTRALQKMIENLSNHEQVDLVIQALRERVVELIQDLNGNHVIQKCLNRLNSADAQFIFNAVGKSCIDVGTHRHGCCVLQRCIDHAEGLDKVNLIHAITQHALVLVQDPFGNYVIQYIIDLNDPNFTNPIVSRFLNDVVELSRHKFSSNVIEKCLRCASDDYKDMIVNSLLASGKINDLVRDQFGNYVIQTSLDHATVPMKRQLIDAIRPILPSVRNTPFGRKIQHKIHTYDGGNAFAAARIANTQQTSLDASQGHNSVRSGNSRATLNGNSTMSTAYQNGTNGVTESRGGQDLPYTSEVTQPTSQRPQQAQDLVSLQLAQPKDDLISPQRAKQSQAYTPIAQRAQQNQGYVHTPQRAQQNQGYAPPQQFNNRLGGSSYPRGNGSPGTNGTLSSLGNGVSQNRFNAPDVSENGEQNFF